jgi:hypothetical protein
MELDVCPESLGLDPSQPNNAQLGHIIEGRYIETIELGAARLVEGFRPVTDTGGYDWAGCPYGQFDQLRLVQFKATLALRKTRGTETVEFMFNAPSLRPHRNTSLLFGRFEREVAQLADPLWLVPSLKLAEVARRHYCEYHGFEHWQFRANVRPEAHDMAAPYRVAQRRLAERLFPPLRPAKLSWTPGLSPLQLEKGAYFESAFATRFLQASTGTEKLLKPETDLGRDLLAVCLQPFSWASLAIKGTIAINEGTLHVRIPGRTFLPHRRHFVLVQHFDETRDLPYPRSWLIPSIVFARLADRSAGDFQMETTLDSKTNRWARYAIATEEDALTFIRWMRRPPAV